MIDSQQVKELALGSGARLCGIAPVERFAEAPAGFHPSDVFPATESVVVLAKLFPEGSMQAAGPVPYTAANTVLLNDVIRITCDLCVDLEKKYGLTAVPIPSEPYEYWDVDRKEGKGLLSLKHAGHLAGLGAIGRNSLLTNRKHGNRLVLGAILLNVELEGDPIDTRNFCAQNCSLCVDSCPVGAIEDFVVNQKLCRGHSGHLTPKGYYLDTCNQCRKVCPNGGGVRNRAGS